MREIKFRGKRVDNGKWVYGFLDINPHFKDRNLIFEHIINAYDDTRSYVYEVVPETVGQFTGMKDKNGVEIYDHDVARSVCELLTNFGTVRTGKYVETIQEVYWDVNKCAWYSRVLKSGTSVVGYVSQIIPSIFSKYNEVIGNIHQNTELLESD